MVSPSLLNVWARSQILISARDFEFVLFRAECWVKSQILISTRDFGFVPFRAEY